MRYILCLLLICSLGSRSYGVTIAPDFRYITMEDGLHYNTVRSIYQDAEGFMWFGGRNGLYRYDGSTLKRAFDKLPIAFEGTYEILSIVEDSNRHLWLGTNFGVFIYNLETERTTEFKAYTKNGDTLRNNECRVKKDKDGIIWISSNGQGLFTYNIHTKILENFGSKHVLDLKNISSIHVSHDNKIWFTTFVEMIYCYDKVSDQMDHYISGKNDYILNICIDPRGNVWYGTMKGLFCINAKTGKEEQKLFSKLSSDIFIVNDLLWDQEKLYVATNKSLHIYDALKNEWKESHSNNISGYINDSHLSKVFIDKQGNLWLTTLYGGVNYYSSSFSNFTKDSHINSELQTPIITSFTKDNNDNLWIGTANSGFYFFDRINDNIISYNSGEQRDVNSRHYNIQSLLVDNDYLYVGMQIRGLDVLNLRTKEIKNLRNESADFMAENIYALYKDSDGMIWIGTNRGLYYLDTKTWRTHHVDEIPSDLVFCIEEDKKGNIWICSDNIGVSCYNKKTNRSEKVNEINNKNKLPTDQVRTLTIDNNKIYFGTMYHGVYVYDLNDYSFDHLDIENTSDCTINKIILNKEELWLSTGKGLLCYNQIKKTTNRYTVRDGLKSDQFWRNAGIKMDDGMIYVGGSRGFSAFHPSELNLITQNPPLVLTNFYINHQKVDTYTKDSPLRKSIVYCDTVILKDEQRNFGIGFQILNYTGTIHCKYQYKLEPFDKEWISTSLHNNIANYTNLPAGEYKFIIMSLNQSGEWNKIERSLVIKILPPWWWSLPFLICYSLLFILLLFAVFFMTRKKYKRRLKKVEIDKEKELNQSKIDFFTTIVHELRTPLTLISVPLDRALKGVGIQDVTLDLQMAKRNSERLLTLVNQLMDFRKMEEHAMIINIETVDIKSLLNKICQEFRLSAEVQKKSLHTELPLDLCYAKIDKEAYIKIITNILSNALKFTKDTIIVRLGYDESRTKWKISIIDNGNGISELEQQNIFKPFYQVQEERLSDNIGTGIGLSLVARLVSLLNGKIEVESQVGEGAEFILFFDIEESTLIDYATKEYEENEYDDNEKGEKVSILIVEDNIDMRNLLFSVLNDKFVVHSTEDGLSAIEKLKEHSFDLIISDIMMPKMDGLELCKYIKTDINTSHIPVILLTAKVSENAIIEGLETGADIYIKKPFSQKILIAQIYSLLRNREKLFINYREKPEVELQSITNTEADKDFINKLNQFIENNIDNSELSVDEIFPEFFMGRTVFFAKVKGVSGMTPNEYIRTVRLKKAAQYFMEGETYINEVAYKVGFSSHSHFGKCFLRQFNLSPSNFIKNHCNRSL